MMKTTNFMCLRVAVFLAFLFSPASWMGQVPAGESQILEHDWVAALRYPGITIDPHDDISVDLIVKNSGRSAETIFLEVTEKPNGWKAQIKGFGKIINGVFVAGGEERTLTFTAKPEGEELKELPAGTYRFVIQAKNPQASAPQTSSLDVTVVEKEKAEEKVSVTTSYPVLRGPSGTKFEFSLDARNDSDEDAVFNFKATAPEGWEVSFKPSYEEKQISSLKIESNMSKSVELEVDPAYNAEAGEYPINVQVQSPKAKAELELSVVLTGTYKIATATVNNLLSLTTYIGKEAIMDLYIQNDGSAPQEEISFLSFKPENWEVEFDPEKIQNLKPGEVKQVQVKIMPADEALVGDYSVAIRVEGEKATDDVELRITVKASTLWGWIGVGIILVVVIGLAVIFKILGRR